ncbi:MAG TPA: adenosine kinase [Verrucomicrobiae bacterium]|nr:adenosine kinase [Verrucomicrobiae bacterium]
MGADLYDVVGIGNAIVDVIASADEPFLERHGMTKGSMMLVDAERAAAIYAEMGAAIIASGGSAANTIAGIASLGGRTGYIGKVADDDFGAAFRHDIRASGAVFATPTAGEGPPTAHCLIIVTPDSQRTMNTYLGACTNIGEDDVDPEMIRSASMTYLEGYLYDDPRAKRAFELAASIAHDARRKVALSLSDPFCVERHRADFHALIDRHVDVLFANEAEALALFETSDLDEALRGLRGVTGVAAVTRGAAGSLVLSAETVVTIEAAPVPRVVDTTGAGDLYAAGFLYALARGAPLEKCGALASLTAGEIIGHFGARPQSALAPLAAFI